nr:hypothetical protein [Shewanella sp.]
MTGIFVLFQLLIIELKHDYAGYIDYEELYYCFSITGLGSRDVIETSVNSMFSALNASAWYSIVGSALLIWAIVAVFITLLGRDKTRYCGPISLRALVVISLGCVSVISSITLYRYTFVLGRTLVNNMLMVDDGLQSDGVASTKTDSNTKIHTETNIHNIHIHNINNNNNSTGPVIDVMAALRDTHFGSDYSVIAHATGGNLVFNGSVLSMQSGHSAQSSHSISGADTAEKTTSLRYSNSLQALNYAIRDGKKLIEVDLLSTSDGVLIAGHDWPRVKAIIGYNGEYDRKNHNATPLSFAEFAQLRATSEIQPLDIVQINTLFANHPQLVLVTDKTHDYPNLLKHFAFTDRLIVECFNLFQCKRATQYGVKHVALNVYMKNRDLVNYLLRNDIAMVTYRGVTKQDSIAYTNALAINQAGIVTLVYTSNDNLDYMKHNIGVTASAIYTDFFSVKRAELIRYN